MKQSDVTTLLCFGMVLWLSGTFYYARRGHAVLEAGAIRYWVIFALSPIVSALLCMGIVHWLGVSKGQWASAMLLLALPGMVGEAVVLTDMSRFLPNLRANTGGPYAALLFATYAAVLMVGEVVTLRARQ